MNLKSTSLTIFALLLLLLLVACGGETDPVAAPLAPQSDAKSEVTGGESEPAITVNEGDPNAISAAEVAQAETAAVVEDAATDPNPNPLPTIPATLPPPQLSTPVQPTAIPTAPPPAATDTPAAINLLSPADFGGDRNPLTGEIVDPAVLQRRPLAVKISNSPPLYVRPQSGLNSADIVFEHITEGNLTRLTMIVYGEDPAQVGPIRSARLIDVELPAMYDAGLVYSGASTGVSRELLGSDFAGRIVGTGEGGYFRTGENKPVEHTLYARPEEVRRALAGKGENRTPAFGQQMTFSSQPPAGGTSASEITIDFKYEKVVWRYDAATNRYFRTAGNVPHNDGLTGEQVYATNIVIPFVNHVDDPNICEEIRNDQCYLLSVEIQLWGSGTALVYRDGQQYQAIWKRENRNDMLTFYTETGEPLPLQIGNSWVEVMSVWYENPVTTVE